MRRTCAVLLFLTAACSASPVGAPATNTPPPSVASASAIASLGAPASPFAPGTCTRPGITGQQLVLRWLELAGRHDAPAVRDCFASSYGVPGTIVDRWANLGGISKSTVQHTDGAIHNGCDFFGVSATFPNGNPYAPVQSPNDMFLVVGVGTDGDRPRIFGTATAGVQQSPDVTPHVGPPDCR